MLVPSLFGGLSSLGQSLFVGVPKDLDITRKSPWLLQFAQRDSACEYSQEFRCPSQVSLAASVRSDGHSLWMLTKDLDVT